MDLSATANENHASSMASSHKTIPLYPQVHSLANDIYQEFEKLTLIHGTEFLRNLVPLVVSALENLDLLYADKEDLQLSLALAHEDKKHLINEYEKEKSLRKNTEAKLLKLEDQFDEERKSGLSKMVQMEASLKVAAVKIQNITEHLSHSEESEHQLLKENTVLRSRYNDVLRYFTFYLERVRNLRLVDPSEQTQPLPDVDLFPINVHHYARSNGLFEFPIGMNSDQRQLEFDRQRILKNILETTAELESYTNLGHTFVDPNFDELTQDDIQSDNGLEIRSIGSSYCTPQLTAEDSSNLDIFSGVKREVNNLIKENHDLVQTKNALNVVTSDLIGRIDDLTCENARLNSERTALISQSTGMFSRIKDLEHECFRLRQELENMDMCDSICSDSLLGSQSHDVDETEPLSNRRYFSRTEMARVLFERNSYKEQLMEFRDTTHLIETLRAERETELKLRPQKRRPLLKWFSRLFASKSRVSANRSQTLDLSINSSSFGLSSPRAPSNLFSSAGPNEVTSTNGHPCSTQQTADSSALCSSTPIRPTTSSDLSAPMEWVCMLNPSPHVFTPKESFVYAYHFLPLDDSLTGFKIWCATCAYPGLNPKTSSEHRILQSNKAGLSAHSSPPTETASLQSEFPTVSHVDTVLLQTSDSSSQHTGLIWVCSVATGLGNSSGMVSCLDPDDPSSGTTQSHTAYSLITLFDMNEPFETVDSFAITSSTVLCMTAVPADSLETQTHLAHTDSYWNAVPLDQESGSSPILPTPDEDTNRDLNTVGLVDSACWSTQSYSTTTTTALMDRTKLSVGGSQSRLVSGVRSFESRFGLNSSYSVERRYVSSIYDRRAHVSPNSTHSSSNSRPNVVGVVSTAQPTVWVGCYNGDLYIHSSVSDWRTCLHVVHLPDAITQIRHFKGRVFVTLANGQLVVFRRHLHSAGSLNRSVESSDCGLSPTPPLPNQLPAPDPAGTWNLTEVCLITWSPNSSAIQPTIVVPVTDCIWSACGSRIRVIDAVSFQAINCFEVHSTNDAYIRHMCVTRNGVWVAMRHLSMLQLYHATTHQLLQTVDLEPMVIGRLVDLKVLENSFYPAKPSSVGVTCLATVENQLWVGTNLGLVFRFPLEFSHQQFSTTYQPASDDIGVKCLLDAPIAKVSGMQVSRHQHAGSVRFLIPIDDVRPSTDDAKPCDEVSCRPHRILISGGRGYTFRSPNDEAKRGVPQTAGCVIVWKS